MKWIRKRKCGKGIVNFLLFMIALVICLPVILTVLASLKSDWELKDNLLPILTESKEAVHWKALPFYPTLKHYIKLLLGTPQFFTVFWNSIKMVAVIMAGQAVVAIPAGWAFAQFSFRGKRLLLTLYIILMLMPFQVTMLPSYLVIDWLNLMDTQAAVVLPAIFSAFPVFIIYRGFLAVSKEIVEAAKVDGAGEFAIFTRIGIPLGMPGILSAMVLGFLEYWNMMEQPLAFLKDKKLWPLSLYLPEIGVNQAGIALAASVVILIPAGFVFVMGQDYLEQGIIATGSKG